MKTKGITPIGAERLLIAGIVLLIGLLFADIYFMNSFLSSKAKETEHARIDAEISNTDIDNMRKAGEKLASYEDAVEQTDQIIGESKLYQYQNQIISDIESYASISGVRIAGFAFTSVADSTLAAPGATTAPTTAPPAAADGSTPAAGAASTVPKDVKSVQTTISFAGDVSYVNLLKFITLIEQNVTRMQIIDLGLTPKEDNRNLLATPSMTILVYTR